MLMDENPKIRLDKKAALHKVYAKQKPFAGLKFFKRTGDKQLRYILVSRHYPWNRCWHWYLDISFSRPRWSRYSWKSYVRRNPQHKAIAAFALRFGFFQISYGRQFVDYQMLDKYFYEAGDLN